MAVIQFSGVGSGLDTAAIVDALVGVARRPINRLQTERDNLNSHKGKVERVKGLLEDLETKALAMDTHSEFFSYKSESTDDTKVIAAASGSANPGSYDITITTLAAAEKRYSDPFSDDDTTGLFGAGTLSIQIGTGTPLEFTVDSSSTLNSVASEINSANANLSASIFYDGSNYRLQVLATESGTDNALTINENGTLSLDLDDVANRVTTATNAAFTVDGFSVSSSTNVVNDAVNGVTLTLLDTTSGTETVTVEADRDEIINKVKDLTEKYNDVVLTLRQELAFNGGVDRSRLVGDGTLRALERDIAAAALYEVSGLSGDYDSLVSIGLTTQEDGTLAVDSATLDDALAASSTAVADVFINNLDTGTEGVAKRLADMIDDYTDFSDGLLTDKSQSLDTRMEDLQDRIDDYEERVAAYEARLSAQYTALERIIASLNTQGSLISSFGAR